MMADREVVENHSNNGEGFRGWIHACLPVAAEQIWDPRHLLGTHTDLPAGAVHRSGRNFATSRIALACCDKSRGAEDETVTRRSAFPTLRGVVSIQQQAGAARAIISCLLLGP